MSITIPHPLGDRIFPDDYLPEYIQEGDTAGAYDPLGDGAVRPLAYWPPRKIFQTRKKDPCYCCLEHPNGDTAPMVPMVEAQHDPVFLVMQDMHFFFSSIGAHTKEGVNKRMEFFMLLVAYDVRGFLRQQKTQIGMTLKEMGANLDWNQFLDRLEAVERKQKHHESLIDEADVRRDDARGPSGYVAVPEDEAMKALRSL